MKRTFIAVMASAAVALALTGCATDVEIKPLAGVADPDVVARDGTTEVRIGDTRADLEHEYGMTQGPGDCAPRLPEQPALSPVFRGDELVLLWADPPLRTPEGISVGSPVSTLDQTYPDGIELVAPAQEQRFDGLLVTGGDHAYLFLHDQSTVQKVIVGSAEHATLLFHEGFGTC
jgi:hypothetical protein